MRNGRKFGLLIAVLVVGAVALPTFAASQRVTVGDLVTKIADAKGLRAVDSTTAEAALRQAGYDLPRIDRSKVLTEGDVAAIANSVGLNVASSNPTSSFSPTQVDRFLTSMGSELSATRSAIGATEVDSNDRSGVDTMSHSGSGKGKKKPHSKSPKKPKKPKPPKPPKTQRHHGHRHH
jgi:hypothetical protein